jgi:hypothetical protein
VPPLIACTTWMPFATVSAPGPPALVMRKKELPVALPPLMTSLSEGELSVPKKVFSAIVPVPV